jgi:hypothetical protein
VSSNYRHFYTQKKLYCPSLIGLPLTHQNWHNFQEP